MEKRERKPNENIQVFVRLRPANAREKAIRSMDMVDVPNNREVCLRNIADAKLNKKFTFDRAFGPESKQNEVYAAVVSPMIEEVLSGYNCTVFAYGQTGTGKTHTMVGEEVPDLKNGWEDDNLVGMIPRAVNHLFDELRMMEMEFSMRVSYLELYNEECFDLLSPDETTKIRIFEDKKGGIIVHGLEEIPVHSKNDVYKLLAKGQEKRRTAPTLMNAQSSRSHTIFSIVVHMKDQKAEGEEMLKIGKLNLVDLAGSENISKAGNEKGVRARETVNINQSLLTLGRVMTALVEHQPHVPYRESKLTRLLQESLGGRTKTSIIATISPGHKDYEETANTLDYAHRAKNIQNRPEVNQRLTKKTVIKEFTEEIDRLKRDLMAARNKDGVFLTEESYNELLLGQESTTKELNEKVMAIRAMKEQLAEKEKLFTEVSLHLVEKTEELKTTQENLKATGNELMHTQTKLHSTDEKYRQQRFLLRHHEHTERKLQGQAKDLLQVAETATTDVSGLHEMVERRRGVEAQNQSKLAQFPGKIEGQFQGFAANSDHFVNRVHRETEGVKYRLDESLLESQKYSDEMSVKLTGIYEVFRALTADNIASFAQLRAEIEANHGAVSETIERSFVAKQKEYEEALKLRLDVIKEKAEKQKTLLDRIHGMASELDKAVNEALQKNQGKMESISSAEEKVMNEMQQKMAELQQKWTELQRLSGEKEESRTATAQVVQGVMRSHVEEQKRAKEEGHQLMRNVVGEVDGVEEMSKERTLEVDSGLVDVQKVLTLAQESVQRNQETFQGDIEKKKGEFEASAEVVKQRIVTEMDRQTKASGETQKNVAGLLEMTQEFVGDFNAFAKNCTKTVKVFCTAELETYRPTGETPAKKNFNYPKQLSQTSPHGRILQRFRYDPNNSFNSSSDILPGLEDEESGVPSEAKIDEEQEEEEAVVKGRSLEEEEEFEDAKEEASPEKEGELEDQGRFSENNENENPNTQKRRVLGSLNKAANRNIIGVQQQETIYVLSDDVSGKGKGKRGGAVEKRSPLRTKSPASNRSSRSSSNSSGSSGRSSLQTKSPAWRN